MVKAGVKARAAAITFPPPCLSSARYCSHDPNPDPNPNQARAAVVPPASGDAMLAARATLLSSLQAVDKVMDPTPTPNPNPSPSPNLTLT